MSVWVDTTGYPTYAIGICARCSIKFPLDELQPDINYPGLMVCRDDADDLDPYRLPPRQVEEITLSHPRPDTPLTTITVEPNTPAWPIDENSP